MTLTEEQIEAIDEKATLWNPLHSGVTTEMCCWAREMLLALVEEVDFLKTQLQDEKIDADRFHEMYLEARDLRFS